MNRPTIPICLIIPVYDRPLELARALNSIANQSVHPQQVIVVDDASPTPIVVEGESSSAFDIKLIRHGVNKGAAGARNTGLRAARTRFVSFLDSDDVLLPGSLAQRWQEVEQCASRADREARIYGCGWLDLGRDGHELGRRTPLPSAKPSDFASGCWFSPGSCIIIDGRAAVAAVGFQDESLRRFEDLDWFLRLSLAGFSLQVTSVFGCGIERKRNTEPARLVRDRIQLEDKWRRRMLDKRLFRRLKAYLDLEISAANYFAGSRAKALWFLLKSLARMPRLSLQLSPGWTVTNASGRAIPDHA